MKWRFQQSVAWQEGQDPGPHAVTWQHFARNHPPSPHPLRDVEAENRKASTVTPRLVDNASHLLQALRSRS